MNTFFLYLKSTKTISTRYDIIPKSYFFDHKLKFWQLKILNLASIYLDKYISNGEKGKIIYKWTLSHLILFFFLFAMAK